MIDSKSLLKAVVMYLIYFLYTYFGASLVQMFSGINEYVVMLVLDLLFLVFIAFSYRQDLKDKFLKLKNDYSFKKISLIVIVSVVGLFLLNIVLGAIIGLILPDTTGVDSNTSAIIELVSMSTFYTVFKTMIFGVVAEELLFREALSKCFKNNVVFVIVSALIYTAMNFIFTGDSFSTQLISEMVIYFIPALVFSTIYVRNNRNIYIVMLVKFIYNLIPLALLFVSL